MFTRFFVHALVARRQGESLHNSAIMKDGLCVSTYGWEGVRTLRGRMPVEVQVRFLKVSKRTATTTEVFDCLRALSGTLEGGSDKFSQVQDPN